MYHMLLMLLLNIDRYHMMYMMLTMMNQYKYRHHMEYMQKHQLPNTNHYLYVPHQPSRCRQFICGGIANGWLNGKNDTYAGHSRPDRATDHSENPAHGDQRPATQLAHVVCAATVVTLPIIVCILFVTVT
jgi:hypothetical protein